MERKMETFTFVWNRRIGLEGTLTGLWVTIGHIDDTSAYRQGKRRKALHKLCIQA